MDSFAFSLLFVGFLLLTLALRFWLDVRQIRHVQAHRNLVPTQFSQSLTLAAHQKAADYSVAKTRFDLLSLFVNAAVLIGFTLLGGLQYLSSTLLHFFNPGMTYQIALLAGFSLVTAIIGLPFDYYRQFVLEEKFGFNKMTFGLFVSD